MITRGGKAVVAATKAAVECMGLPKFRVSRTLRDKAEVVDSRCLGLDNPDGFVDHVVMTLRMGQLEYDIYAAVTFSHAGPAAALLYIYQKGQFKATINCLFRSDGVPDPWATR
jgi:hypothetical protein